MPADGCRLFVRKAGNHTAETVSDKNNADDAVIFNPAVAGRALILRSGLRYNDVHFIPR
jgi:hypothetical protein